MPTKKETAVKTTAPKKTTAKKAAAKKPAVKKAPKSKVTLVSFEVTAVISTQQYGNIQPSITVNAPTIEEAREHVMPMIEDMFKQYSEVRPGFLGRVTASEKVVKPTPAPTPAPTPTNQHGEDGQKSAPFMKAERAIELATGHDALALIEAQVNKSVKIDPADKPALLVMITNRRNELPF